MKRFFMYGLLCGAFGLCNGTMVNLGGDVTNDSGASILDSVKNAEAARQVSGNTGEEDTRKIYDDQFSHDNKPLDKKASLFDRVMRKQAEFDHAMKQEVDVNTQILNFMGVNSKIKEQVDDLEDKLANPEKEMTAAAKEKIQSDIQALNKEIAKNDGIEKRLKSEQKERERIQLTARLNFNNELVGYLEKEAEKKASAWGKFVSFFKGDKTVSSDVVKTVKKNADTVRKTIEDAFKRQGDARSARENANQYSEYSSCCS